MTIFEDATRPADPARHWSESLAAAPVALIAVGALLLCVLPVLAVAYNFEKNYSEGWNAYHALRAASGEVFYSGDPERLVNYPFLSFYLIAWLKPLFGDVLAIGRGLSLISLAAILALSAKIVRQLGGGPLDAAFAAACVLGYHAVAAASWIGADDPQMMAEASMLAGLCWYLGDRGSPRRLAVTAILLGIGGFTKHNIIGIPAAITIDILWHDRRLFLRWCGLAAATILGMTALAYLVAGGDFLHELLAPRALTFEHPHHAQKFAKSFKLPLIVAAAYLARWAPPGSATILRAWGIVSLAFAVAFSFGDGVSYNIFLDTVLFLAIVSALALGRWRAGLIKRGGIGRAASLVLPLALAQPILSRLPESSERVAALPDRLAELAEQEGRTEAARRLLRAHPGPALCDSLFLCFEAGKPLLVDPYNAKQMILTGRLAESVLIDEIKQHRFALIEVPTRIYIDVEKREISPYLLTPSRFTENTFHAIEEYYEPNLKAGHLTFYSPKTVGATAASAP